MIELNGAVNCLISPARAGRFYLWEVLFMSWELFVSYATDPVFIGLGGGVILSFLAVYIPGFNDLAPKWKRLAFGASCLVVALALTALGISTGVRGQWGDIPTTWFPSLYAAIAAVGTGTLVHTRKLSSSTDA